MKDNEFSDRITAYLQSEGKAINEVLLSEVGIRCIVAFQRQLMEDRENTEGRLRLSSAGHCQRKQWYQFHGYTGEPLSARTINTFLFGDLCEVALSVVARLAGWQLSGKPNGEDSVKIRHNDRDVVGHLDDLLYNPDDDKYRVVECKSMSEIGYRMFEENGLTDDWGYMTQASLYCEAMGVDEYILAGICKNTGHFCDRLYRKDNALIDKAHARWHAAIGVNIPDREWSPVEETRYNRSTKQYDSTGRCKLGMQCSYCSFRDECWKDAGLIQEFKGDRPVWVVPSNAKELEPV